MTFTMTLHSIVLLINAQWAFICWKNMLYSLHENICQSLFYKILILSLTYKHKRSKLSKSNIIYIGKLKTTKQ